MLMDKLNALNPGKSTGLNGLHPYFLYSLADILCSPLNILFTKSVRKGIIPSQWVETFITAIHKKGLKSAVGNYRPVSMRYRIKRFCEVRIDDIHVKT